MNWVPGAFPEPVPAAEVETGDATTLLEAATIPDPPPAAPAFAFGPVLDCALPNPHPPSLSCAGITAAQAPLRNPQHNVAQSASEVQAPVMNCVPWAVT
jgi:hypothetical protein